MRSLGLCSGGGGGGGAFSRRAARPQYYSNQPLIPRSNTNARGGERSPTAAGSSKVPGGVILGVRPVAPNFFLAAQHIGGAMVAAFVLNGFTYHTTAFFD